MLEVEFRGRGINSQDWVFGSLVNLLDTSGSMFILQKDLCPRKQVLISVETESIGQYVGQKDKYGIKMFTGDIVSDGDEVGTITFDKYKLLYTTSCPKIDLSEWWKLSVVGNIYD